MTHELVPLLCCDVQACGRIVVHCCWTLDFFVKDSAQHFPGQSKLALSQYINIDDYRDINRN